MSKALNVLVAAVGGFVAGVLLAPKSGKETRQDLMNKKDEYMDKAKAGLNEVREGASNIKDELASGADAVKETAKNAAGQVGDAAKRVRSQVADTAESVKKSANETAKDTKRSAR